MASPAPWKDSGQLGFGRWITAEDGTQVAVSYGPSVNPNSEANTRLIIGAPDLRAALKEIEHSARCNGGGFLTKAQLLNVVRRQGEIARAALVKLGEC